MTQQNTTIIFQTHIHSNKSHDSKTSIEEYVKYFESKLKTDEIGVLGVTDHNCLPISTRAAQTYSTSKVVVVPGIQWKLHKSVLEALRRRATRREILTLGNHDNLLEFITQNTSIKIDKKTDILTGNLTEQQLLNFLNSSHGLTLIVPHPSHGFVDYYGPKQIKKLAGKVDQLKTTVNFLVEVATGYDPFPRIFYNYAKRYRVIASSDAHQIKSAFGTDSFFSAYSTLAVKSDLLAEWKKIHDEKDISGYHQVIINIGNLLISKNEQLVLNKNFFKSTLHFMHSFPSWVTRRFQDFPQNLTS